MLGSVDGQQTEALTDAESEAPPRSEAYSRSYRLTALRPSSVPPPANEPVLRAVTDVLLAAAQADGTACQRELRTLRRILKRLTDSDVLPDWVEPHIAAFEPEKFELEA